MPSLSPSPLDNGVPQAGGRHRRGHGVSVKTLKRALKKAGLKTTGRKAALTRRAKKAHLLKMRGGDDDVVMCDAPLVNIDGKCVKDPNAMDESEGGSRRRHRSRKH